MVFVVDNKSKKIIATLRNGGKIEKYECSFTACTNPVCTCGTVHLTLTPIQPGDKNEKTRPVRKVEIDVDENSLISGNEETVPKQDIEFAKHLFSKMDKNDFQILYRKHFKFKNEISEQVELDSIDAHFEYDKVEYDGLMYAYSDILPYGDQLLATIEGKDCIIFDQYCLLPKCKCTDMGMDIIYLEKGKKEGNTICTVFVNYRKKHWRFTENNPYTGNIKTIKAAIEKQIPNIYKRLLERHIKVKAIYAHCKNRHLSEQARETIKVGRNELCPCGSGKKYKKCCFINTDL